jgi:hypothetical protein
LSAQLNLKEIERKAFRSTFQDGLWDIYLGLIVIAMSMFIYRPPDGYSAMNIIVMLIMFVLAYTLFRLGKKYITIPRMGQVQFGYLRKQKKRTMAIILGVFVVFQIGLVGLTAFGWANPETGAKFNALMGDSDLIIVAAIGSFIVGTSMIVNAYFSDFPRGYFIAMMMALAVFLMIYLNQPIYPITIGGLIIIPGLVLFLRFLMKYPLQQEGGSHE